MATHHHEPLDVRALTDLDVFDLQPLVDLAEPALPSARGDDLEL